jgi:hypothetical protein
MTKIELEEKILEIIGEYVPENQKKSYCNLAHEIASLFEEYYEKEFVIWKEIEVTRMGSYYRIWNGNAFIMINSFDKVYAFWKKEIRK